MTTLSQRRAQQQQQQQSTVAMPVPGDLVVIVRGRNIGKRGQYIKNVAFNSCLVLLESSDRPQRFLKTSVATAIEAAPTPIATAVLLGGASPAQQDERRVTTQVRSDRTQDIQSILTHLNDLQHGLNSLEERLRELLLGDT
jgi:Iap family predicted aminopeptidase